LIKKKEIEMSEKPDVDVKAAIIQLREEQVFGWVRDQLDLNTMPHEIMDRLSAGLKNLGDMFASGKCFIPELIRGGEIFLKALEMVRPALEAHKAEIKRIGSFLIGTVKGDLHDLGKNLTAITLMTAGFEVIDLGKDVPTDKFVEEVERIKPDILGLSALLTTTTEQQLAVIETLKAANLRDNIKIIVGGAPVNQKWADHIGADAYGADAIDGLRKSKILLGIQ
jgi:5-methyltetrahydrofolate--homocysteine methyltransferase